MDGPRANAAEGQLWGHRPVRPTPVMGLDTLLVTWRRISERHLRSRIGGDIQAPRYYNFGALLLRIPSIFEESMALSIRVSGNYCIPLRGCTISRFKDLRQELTSRPLGRGGQVAFSWSTTQSCVNAACMIRALHAAILAWMIVLAVYVTGFEPSGGAQADPPAAIRVQPMVVMGHVVQPYDPLP